MTPGTSTRATACSARRRPQAGDGSALNAGETMSGTALETRGSVVDMSFTSLRIADRRTRGWPGSLPLPDPAQLAEQRKQELLLAVEVQVDGPVGDPGLARDLAHRGPVESLTGEDPAGRCQDLCPPPIDPLLLAH